MVPNGQYNIFLIIWDIFGLIWTFLDHFRQNLIFCSKLLWPRSTLCFWGKKSIFVLKGPKRCKWAQMVPNGQKHVILTIWDHLGPFWTTSGHWQAYHVRPFLVPNGPFLDASWPGMGPGAQIAIGPLPPLGWWRHLWTAPNYFIILKWCCSNFPNFHVIYWREHFLLYIHLCRKS